MALSNARCNASASRTEKALALLLLGDRQPTDQGATDERIAGDVLPCRLRHLALRGRHYTKRVIAEDAIRLGIPAQHEYCVSLPAHVLAGLSLEIAIETLDLGIQSNPQAWNSYSYAGNNPTSITDVTGYDLFDDLVDLGSDILDSISGFFGGDSGGGDNGGIAGASGLAGATDASADGSGSHIFAQTPQCNGRCYVDTGPNGSWGLPCYCNPTTSDPSSIDSTVLYSASNSISSLPSTVFSGSRGYTPTQAAQNGSPASTNSNYYLSNIYQSPNMVSGTSPSTIISLGGWGLNGILAVATGGTSVAAELVGEEALTLAAEEGLTTAEQLTAAAGRAVQTVGPGSGPVYGTAVHSAFEAEVNALGDANLATEQSYLNGNLVSRGTQGVGAP